MDSVAASGGYWISMNANKIVASKTTITGSIGVIGVQFDFSTFSKDFLGVTYDEVKSSKSSDFFSSLHPIIDGSHRDNKMNELIDKKKSGTKLKVIRSMSYLPDMYSKYKEGLIKMGLP